MNFDDEIKAIANTCETAVTKLQAQVKVIAPIIKDVKYTEPNGPQTCARWLDELITRYKEMHTAYDTAINALKKIDEAEDRLLSQDQKDHLYLDICRFTEQQEEKNSFITTHAAFKLILETEERERNNKEIQKLHDRIDQLANEYHTRPDMKETYEKAKRGESESVEGTRFEEIMKESNHIRAEINEHRKPLVNDYRKATEMLMCCLDNPVDLIGPFRLRRTKKSSYPEVTLQDIQKSLSALEKWVTEEQLKKLTPPPPLTSPITSEEVRERQRLRRERQRLHQRLQETAGFNFLDFLEDYTTKVSDAKELLLSHFNRNELGQRREILAGILGTAEKFIGTLHESGENKETGQGSEVPVKTFHALTTQQTNEIEDKLRDWREIHKETKETLRLAQKIGTLGSVGKIDNDLREEYALEEIAFEFAKKLLILNTMRLNSTRLKMPSHHGKQQEDLLRTTTNISLLVGLFNLPDNAIFFLSSPTLPSQEKQKSYRQLMHLPAKYEEAERTTRFLARDFKNRADRWKEKENAENEQELRSAAQQLYSMANDLRLAREQIRDVLDLIDSTLKKEKARVPSTKNREDNEATAHIKNDLSEINWENMHFNRADTDLVDEIKGGMTAVEAAAKQSAEKVKKYQEDARQILKNMKDPNNLTDRKNSKAKEEGQLSNDWETVYQLMDSAVTCTNAQFAPLEEAKKKWASLKNPTSDEQKKIQAIDQRIKELNTQMIDLDNKRKNWTIDAIVLDPTKEGIRHIANAKRLKTLQPVSKYIPRMRYYHDWANSTIRKTPVTKDGVPQNDLMRIYSFLVLPRPDAPVPENESDRVIIELHHHPESGVMHLKRPDQSGSGRLSEMKSGLEKGDPLLETKVRRNAASKELIDKYTKPPYLVKGASRTVVHLPKPGEEEPPQRLRRRR